MTTTISLLRHGLVENPEAVYYGRLPHFGLAARGRAQAIAAGRYLADANISAIYHSPLLRAEQTAGLVAALVVSAALARLRDGCLAIADEVQGARQPLLIDRLAGIESELYRLANFADEQSVGSWRLPPKGDRDGGR